jgi:exodeoxyribonuclease V alpha subunit
MATLSGSITKIRWRNADNSWAVASFTVLSGKDKYLEMTVVGNLPYSDPDEIFEITGEWESNKEYGEQFKVISAFRQLPTTSVGLERYLARQIDGVGPAKAGALVNEFGTKLVEILDSDPDALMNCKGISKTLAERITKSWSKDKAKRQIGMFLAQYGISPDWAPRISDAFGIGKAVEVVTSNPYLLTKVDGIGFKTADGMAKSMGWPKISPQRTEAAFTYVLQENNLKGNVFMHQGQLIEEVCHIAGVSEEECEKSLNNVLARSELIREEINDRGITLPLLYLPKLYKAETELAEKVIQASKVTNKAPDCTEALINLVSEDMHKPLSDQQKGAILYAISNNLSIITGGPGTGKTTIVQALVRVAERLGKTCVLMAPTGRASKRLSEVASRPASTIHRALKFDPKEYKFGHDKDNPLLADLVIVDESSMLDLDLAHKLFEAIPDNCSVVLIGDTDQLPAVGPGMVLKDLITSNKTPTTTLTNIFRQAEGSLIIQNAHKIRRGELPTFPPKGTDTDSYFIEVPKCNGVSGKKVEDISWLKATLSKLVKESIPGKLNIDPVKDIQVLVPMKKGTAGVPELNIVLQETLNPKGMKFSVEGREFRLGDRVMQLKNNYGEDVDVYNGDIGIIKAVNKEEKLIRIDFYGKLVDYPFESVGDLQLAYAQTIHKSQGSEYPVVIIVMLMQHFAMLERNLLYTANTRAKQMAIFLASKGAVELAAKRCQVKERNTSLSMRIRKGFDE